MEGMEKEKELGAEQAEFLLRRTGALRHAALEWMPMGCGEMRENGLHHGLGRGLKCLIDADRCRLMLILSWMTVDGGLEADGALRVVILLLGCS